MYKTANLFRTLGLDKVIAHSKGAAIAAVSLVAATLSALALAGEGSYKTFGNHQVHYSVFNSSFIQPEIARLYNITRGKNRALVNIALTGRDSNGGLAAKVSGTATNLMQQQRRLDFLEIREKNAVYYLAPLRFTNEEVLNFSIEVIPEGQPSSYTLKFTKTLYVDN